MKWIIWTLSVGFHDYMWNGNELVALLDDFWQEQDGSSASIPALLDVSMAFNITNHGILLGWLCFIGGGRHSLVLVHLLPLKPVQ